MPTPNRSGSMQGAAPPPWAGDPTNRPLRARRRPTTEPLTVPPGTVVTAIPSWLTARKGHGPLRATGADALRRVRERLIVTTRAPFAPLHPVGRELESWAEGAGWWIVVVYPDGTTNERAVHVEKRHGRTVPAHHDVDALTDVTDLDDTAGEGAPPAA